MNNPGSTSALCPKALCRGLILGAEPTTPSVAGFLRSCSGCEGVKNGVWQGEQSRPLLPAVGAVPGSPRAAACSARPLLPSLPSVPGFTAGPGSRWEGRTQHRAALAARLPAPSLGQVLPLPHLWPHSSVIQRVKATRDTKGQWELSSRQSQSLAKFTVRMGHPPVTSAPCTQTSVEGTHRPGPTWDELTSTLHEPK